MDDDEFDCSVFEEEESSLTEAELERERLLM